MATGTRLSRRLSALALWSACATSSGAWAQGGAPHEATFPTPGEPKVVRIVSGESVRLSWADAGSGAFIVGLGPVPAHGNRTFAPTSDTTYTLIGGDGPAATLRSVDVVVSGRKGRGVGNPDFPPLTEYRTTVDAVVAGVPYPALVERVYRYLQDTCGHEVESTHKPWEKDYTLWTNYAKPGAAGRSACVDEVRGIDTTKRRVGTAFFVRLTPSERPGAGAAVEIGAVARFRFANEERWRPVEDAAVNTSLADGLRRRLESFK